MPTSPGGGTVAYVNPLEHVYLEDPEHREEGGTPAIVESIRAGLVFKLKEAVGVDAIRRREEDFIERAIASWLDVPEIQVLGNPTLPRLSIVSFTIRHDGRYLHHNFVVAVLNDLFGIQSRGGCSCAGPYGHRLLGIDIETSHGFEREIARGCEGIKPGWVRVNFNYFIGEAVFDYVVRCRRARRARGLAAAAVVPLRGRDRPLAPRRRLTGAAAVPPRRGVRRRRRVLSVPSPHPRRRGVRGPPGRGRADPGRPGRRARRAARRRGTVPEVGDDFESLRWFWLPDEVRDALPT